MPTKGTHTPTPWDVAAGRDGPSIMSGECQLVTVPIDYSEESGSWSCYEGNDEDADFAFIVTAVNSHDALLAALKGCAAVLDAVLNGNGTNARDTDIALTAANAAIAQAEGGK